MKVKQILEDKGQDVFTMSADQSVKEAISLLADHNIGAIVVVDKAGVVTGILSERDVVRASARDGAMFMQKPIKSCMTAKVVTCCPQDSVDDLMGLMTAKRIRHLPVLDEGKLSGLVSIGDVVKRKIRETEQEAAALRDYIATG